MIPHIVFSDAEGYFPGPEWWDPDGVTARPQGVATSGITQPPVHGFCLKRMSEIGNWQHSERQRFLQHATRAIAKFHRWLERTRMSNKSGLVAIRHGWESGMDNSPRFDGAYEVVPPFTGAFHRQDLNWATHEDRPSQQDYGRYVRLITEMAKSHFSDQLEPDTSEFLVGDVFSTACLAMSAESLGLLADCLGLHQIAEEQRHLSWKARAAVEHSMDESGLVRDFDLLQDRWIGARTLTSFSPLLLGASCQGFEQQLDVFTGEHWLGHASLKYRLPPSVSPDDPSFDETKYWRGPVWPIMTWLFAERLRSEEPTLARNLRQATLQQLGDGQFGEYYDPCTGKSLGSSMQSWTAMVAMDWGLQDA